MRFESPLLKSTTGAYTTPTGLRSAPISTGDGRTWSEISVRGGTQSQPVDDRSPHDTVHRYAKRIVGEWAAAGHTETASATRANPFKIPNTFEERAAIAPIQDRIRDQRIAIIGLGGTGAYVLDLLAKTPVPQIHLLDSDHSDWHTFMRAPGAPTAEEIESQEKKAWDKVAYYAAKYDAFREGIGAHPVRVENSASLAEFLSANPVDYAFVCIDQLRDSDSPRQDVVYEALTDACVPFIDSGVSITDRGRLDSRLGDDKCLPRRFFRVAERHPERQDPER